jgi:hypothetical protein
MTIETSNQTLENTRRLASEALERASTTVKEMRSSAQDYGAGWFGHMRRAVRTWWRYHPAHMVADLASANTPAAAPATSRTTR